MNSNIPHHTVIHVQLLHIINVPNLPVLQISVFHHQQSSGKNQTYLVYVENNVLKFAAEHFEGISSCAETREKFTCVLEYNIYT